MAYFEGEIPVVTTGNNNNGGWNDWSWIIGLAVVGGIFGNGGFGFGGGFSGFGGQSRGPRPTKGRDISVLFEMDFEEAAFGTETTVELNIDDKFTRI